MKLLYAMAFALFPVAAAAQTPDALLLTALCHDDYFEDTAGHCNSLARREVLTMEEILAHYGAIISSSDADDESVFYLIDLEEVPVGTIEPRQFGPSDNPIERKDDGPPDLTSKEKSVAAHIITIGSPHENDDSALADADDLGSTGPSPAGVAGNTSILTGEHPLVE